MGCAFAIGAGALLIACGNDLVDGSGTGGTSASSGTGSSTTTGSTTSSSSSTASSGGGACILDQSNLDACTLQ